jgi:hypothetical protein
MMSDKSGTTWKSDGRTNFEQKKDFPINCGSIASSISTFDLFLIWYFRMTTKQMKTHDSTLCVDLIWWENVSNGRKFNERRDLDLVDVWIFDNNRKVNSKIWHEWRFDYVNKSTEFKMSLWI